MFENTHYTNLEQITQHNINFNKLFKEQVIQARIKFQLSRFKVRINSLSGRHSTRILSLSVRHTSEI